MKWISRAIGFVVFALASQYLAWLSKIDVLEDMTIFSLPSAKVVLPISTIAWVVIDGLAACTRSETMRQLVFWSLMIGCGVAAVVVPPLMSSDGLGIGLLRFFFGMWVATAAIYGAVAWGIEALWRTKLKANKSVEHYVSPGADAG